MCPPPTSSTALEEPLLRVSEIQGNILIAFSRFLKPAFQTLLCLRLDDGPEAVPAFKAWLEEFRRNVTSTATMLDYRRERHAREAAGLPPTGLPATWRHIAFSYACLERLAPEARRFRDSSVADAAFAQGMAKRAELLGDPQEPAAEGHPRNWRVGGEIDGRRADVLILVVSNDRARCQSAVAAIRHAVTGAAVIYEEGGPTLPPQQEHFGFQFDGVSQPGVRGRLSADPHDFLTPRRNPLNRDQGLPGQQLLWPGEFVFGYRRQYSPYHALAAAGPSWARDGSFLVFRRLRQDVGAFHQFLRDTAAEFHLDPEYVAAQLVGRWRSGAPLLRAPRADDPAAARRPCVNNYFDFQRAVPVLDPSLKQHPDDCSEARLDDAGQLSPAAIADPRGEVCPFTAHIRKMYPRDDPTPPASGPQAEERRRLLTESHRLLRRSIAYGPPSPSSPRQPVSDGVDRGLLFLAYQTSFERQFEWIIGVWANNPNFQPHSTTDAPHEAFGWDPLIGQNNAPDARRERRFVIDYRDEDGHLQQRTVRTRTDWVVPTGGEYFFVPSLSALERLARA